jgi:hypothetical protein
LYEHPDGGVYFYNKELRLVTMDNILDPIALEAVLEYRLAKLRFLEQIHALERLPKDLEMWVSFSKGLLYESDYSQSEGRCYRFYGDGSEILKSLWE